jgi:hypothetical protein
MTEPLAPDLLREVWEYPLFDALYGRRSRRFGLGFAMVEGPSKYTSQHAPLRLSEAEEALLVAAGFGFSGMALWDQSRPMPYRSADGRTFPSTSRGRRTALFFTNDQGVYVIDPGGGSTSKMREAGTAAERDQALDLYRHHRQVLQDRRLEIPRRAPPLCGHNLWDSNMPGSTLFMPICDVSYSLISLIAQFVDARLERFAATAGRGMHIVDDRFDFSAGRNRRMGQERVPRSRQHSAAVAFGAPSLLLHVQRTRHDLPEHVSCDRGHGHRRVDALRDHVAGNFRSAGLHDD